MKWELKKLGEIATFSQGIQVGLEKQLTIPKEGYVRFIRIVDYTQNTDDLRYVENPGEKYFVSEDDIVMVRYGTPGLIGRGKKGVIANNLFKIKITNNNIINDYLALFLSQYKIQNYLRTQGSATMPALNFGQLKTVNIFFPKSLEEQQTIVTKLDQAFAAIDQAKANIEKNIANAKELFQSKLNQIFSQKGEGWEEKRIDEICQNFDSKRIPITKNKRIEGIYPYYGASGIVDYVSDFIFEGDYLLVSEDGANLLARTYPIAFSVNGKFWVNNHAHILKFVNSNTQKFVEYYLNSIKLDDYVSGMAQPKLNQAKLNSISVPIPFNDFDSQQQIVIQLDQLQEQTNLLVTKYQQKLANLEEFKKSILEKAFKGELV